MADSGREEKHVDFVVLSGKQFCMWGPAPTIGQADSTVGQGGEVWISGVTNRGA